MSYPRKTMIFGPEPKRGFLRGERCSLYVSGLSAGSGARSAFDARSAGVDLGVGSAALAGMVSGSVSVMASKPACRDCGSTTRKLVGPPWRCGACGRAAKARRSERAWELRIQRDFQLSASQYRGILAAQGGVCALCRRATGKTKRLAVDHDHRCCKAPPTCGKCTRGVLCGPCNQWLGRMRDAVPFGFAVVHYLESPPALAVTHGSYGEFEHSMILADRTTPDSTGSSVIELDRHQQDRSESAWPSVGFERGSLIMAKPWACHGCDARWSGLAMAHCSVCHATFSSVGLFDKHRRAARCVPLPDDHRLVDGVWRGPEMTEAQKAARYGAGPIIDPFADSLVGES